MVAHTDLGRGWWISSTLFILMLLLIFSFVHVILSRLLFVVLMLLLELPLSLFLKKEVRRSMLLVPLLLLRVF